MTVFRKQYANPLASTVGGIKGMTVEDATTAAEANLFMIQDDCLASLDQALSVIFEYLPTLSRAEDQVNAELVYRAANQVVALGALCDLPDLGKVAFSLCDLVDRSRTIGKWNTAALETHRQALVLLRRPADDGDHPLTQDMIAGLLRVVSKVSR
jgi:hypothetical protein